jgi:hypothetical protein
MAAARSATAPGGLIMCKNYNMMNISYSRARGPCRNRLVPVAGEARSASRSRWAAAAPGTRVVNGAIQEQSIQIEESLLRPSFAQARELVRRGAVFCLLLHTPQQPGWCCTSNVLRGDDAL